MKKILVINTKYKNYGGEDSNFEEEKKFLKKYYEVDYLNFDHSLKEPNLFFRCLSANKWN